jgi:RHS repeat-associated protein
MEFICLYDGANVVAELDAAGNTVAHYAQGPGIDQALAMLRDGLVSYYHSDGLGSITSLTNPAGANLVTYAYDAFGNMTDSGGNFVNPYRYTGREWDGETGLYYYRARYYDPSIGRFISEDPIHFNGGINFYRYADNAPTNWTDASGLSPQDVQNLINSFNNTVNFLNHNGLRRPGGGTGWWSSHVNGWKNDFWWHSYPWSNTKYKSCGEQAYEVKIRLEGLKTDDKWTIDVIRIDLGFGQATQAHSDNPNDPTLIFDPWLNTVTTIPPKK